MTSALLLGSHKKLTCYNNKNVILALKKHLKNINLIACFSEGPILASTMVFTMFE